MGFFDDIGKKVADAGQKTIKKTKEISDVVRLNALISQEENKIESLYNQIGKLYVSLHATDSEEEFIDMVRNAIESDSIILAYRQQIQDLKGMQRCEICGAEISKDALFCNNCGNSIQKNAGQQTETVEDGAVCPNCGNIGKKDARFCTLCGQQLEETMESESKEQFSDDSEKEVHIKS